ncbi:hypothetical protein F4775DRAFT_606360 [Biscogniauxia sp. FL1348]|nr:hypothetical protein F4775DRAFT_606360 [Biscogniauxia sp. FL1348]
MDFAGLKRRGTDLFNSLPQPSMPSMPAMPHMPHMPQLPSMPRIGGGGGGGKGGPPTMKGTWQHVSVPSFPRSSHSLDIVAGTAYLFGGEVAPGETLDNDMHVLTLPSSGAPADYYAIKAKPTAKTPAEKPESISEEDETAAQLKDPLTEVPLSSPREEVPSSATTEKGKNVEMLPEVPGPRLGHATAVIGTRIFFFGGRTSAEDSDTLNEGGRVWIFETKTHSWSYLDPYRTSPVPPPRSYAAAVATDKPRDFAIKPLRRTASWKQWAEGDSAEVGIPQRPIAGSIAASATDDEDAGFGTFIIHGGVLADGSRTSDVWAFDVRSYTWKELPAAPGPARSGAALALAKSRLYRYGGFDGENEIGGQLDVLHLALDEFNDRVSKGEIGVFARGEWQSLLPPVTAVPPPHSHEREQKPSAETEPAQQQEEKIESDTATVPVDETVNETAKLVETESWPSRRSASTMELVLGGGGREYLVLMFGESSSSTFHSDVWTYQVPPEGMTAASVTDAFLHAVGRRSGEGQWARVSAGPYDDEVDLDVAGPPARGRAAAAPLGDLEENAILVFGGLGANGKRLGDAWVFRLE